MGRYIIVLGVCLVASHPVAAQIPEASELLDKFSENRNRIKSYIAKFEYSLEGLNPIQDISRRRRILMKRTAEIRTDSQRHYSRWVDWTTNMKGLDSAQGREHLSTPKDRERRWF